MESGAVSRAYRTALHIERNASGVFIRLGDRFVGPTHVALLSYTRTIA